MFSQTRRAAQTIAQPRRKGLVTRLLDTLALTRQRRALSELDDALLADLGLTRSEAEAEARRAAWDVPSHWRS